MSNHIKMLTHLPLLILSLALPITAEDPDPYRAVVIDCLTCPNSCNNDCFAVYAANQPSELRYGGPNITRTNHQIGPCGSCPCENTQLKYSRSGNTCVEYPFPSTLQSGKNAIGRCVPDADGADQERQLDAILEKEGRDGGCRAGDELKPCNLIVFLKNYGEGTPFCTGQPNVKPQNDGFEFKLRNDRVVNARAVDSENGLQDVVLQPADFIDLHHRREFVLSDGSRVLALSRDLDAALVGRQVSAADGDPAQIVRELLGTEKTLALQPPIP